MLYFIMFLITCLIYLFIYFIIIILFWIIYPKTQEIKFEPFP